MKPDVLIPSLQLSESTFGQMTLDVSAYDLKVYEEVALPLERLGRRLKAKALAAPQVGRIERICFINLPNVVVGPIYNLLATPDAGVDPLWERPAVILGKTERLLVPVYGKLSIRFSQFAKDETVMDSTDADNNFVFMAAETLLDGGNNLKWVSSDYLTFSRGSRKVGGNDRCPCGSGKKFKNCCRND